MIHPDTTVCQASCEMGNGVFATKDISKGTIIVVKDEYDICLCREEFSKLPDLIRESMENHAYLDKYGRAVLSWDHARYMNHSCCCNTMMTDYQLEIVIRDIKAGDQITTEYGLLNVLEPYAINCGCECCRKELRLNDIDVYGKEWDQLIKAALLAVPDVHQPLWSLVSEETRVRLGKLQEDQNSYSSVQNLKWRC